MRPSNQEYNKMAEKQSPPSSKIKDFDCAYVIGGLICVIGQLLMEWYNALGLPEKVVKMAVPSTIVFIAALLTGLKLFDKIAARLL